MGNSTSSPPNLTLQLGLSSSSLRRYFRRGPGMLRVGGCDREPPEACGVVGRNNSPPSGAGERADASLVLLHPASSRGRR